MGESIRTVGKNGIEVQEYKGEFSLIATHEGKEGKFWQDWGKVKIGKDSYSDKDRPIKVLLGDKVTAVATLLMVLKEITGQEYNIEAPF
jgi:hypothetical protein